MKNFVSSVRGDLWLTKGDGNKQGDNFLLGYSSFEIMKLQDF